MVVAGERCNLWVTAVASRGLELVAAAGADWPGADCRDSVRAAGVVRVAAGLLLAGVAGCRVALCASLLLRMAERVVDASGRVCADRCVAEVEAALLRSRLAETSPALRWLRSAALRVVSRDAVALSFKRRFARRSVAQLRCSDRGCAARLAVARLAERVAEASDLGCTKRFWSTPWW